MWTDDERLARENKKYVGRKSGIISAKKALNNLHFWLGQKKFSQVIEFSIYYFCQPPTFEVKI